MVSWFLTTDAVEPSSVCQQHWNTSSIGVRRRPTNLLRRCRALKGRATPNKRTRKGKIKDQISSIFIHFPCTLDFWLGLFASFRCIFRSQIPASFVVPPYFLDPPTWFSSSRVAMLRSASAVAFCLCNSLVHKIAEWPVNNYKNMTLETMVKPIIVGLGRRFSHWIDLGDLICKIDTFFTQIHGVPIDCFCHGKSAKGGVATSHKTEGDESKWP